MGLGFLFMVIMLLLQKRKYNLVLVLYTYFQIKTAKMDYKPSNDIFCMNYSRGVVTMPY